MYCPVSMDVTCVSYPARCVISYQNPGVRLDCTGHVHADSVSWEVNVDVMPPGATLTRHDTLVTPMLTGNDKPARARHTVPSMLTGHDTLVTSMLTVC